MTGKLQETPNLETSRQFIATSISLEKLSELLPDSRVEFEALQKATGPLSGNPDLETLLLHNWLRWCRSDATDAQMSWEYLAARNPNLDRDELMLRLWEIYRGEEDNSRFRDVIEKGYVPKGYYERILFSWFLSRFNLVAARRIFRSTQGAGWLNGSILAAALLGFAVFLIQPFKLWNALEAFGTFLVVLVLLVVYASGRRLPLIYVTAHSLIPRLAASIALGYLFLASAPQLVRLIYESGIKPPALFAIDLGLSLAAFAYIWLHVSKRVRPTPRARKISARVFNVWALALAYAIALLLPMAPVLFSGSMMYGPGNDLPTRVQFTKLLLCAMFALNLGVVLQLVWDETPLTEPL